MPDYWCESCVDKIGEMYGFTYALVRLNFVCWLCHCPLTIVPRED